MTVTEECAADTVPQATLPRTWAFIDRRTGKPAPYTCMAGCTLDHSSDWATPTFPEDIWCWTRAEHMTLPVNKDGQPEEMRVLSTVIKVEPFSSKIAARLPYAVVQLVDDQFIEDLDPDGYETVINVFAERLDQMRTTHRKLIEIRAAYMARSAA
ncbi:hypothetical protein AB0I27_22810 [Streptomyces sp. NPDC050597]|uniref:DUF6907 domain-containing protein n=1 Tax=Streptomyces sp. NPDC050597 TaxID=3157212 RepID=UPI0034165D32